MVAKIIAVSNQKGGVGKTTVSMQLAGAVVRRKLRVLVVDADPQGTAVRWASSAEDEQIFPVSVVGLSAANGKVHREIIKFVNDYDLIIIDCPPAVDSLVPQSALLVADLVLVPLIPSPLDLWAAVGIKQIIENISQFNEGLKSRLILNQCQPRTILVKESREILSQFGIELLKTKLQQRQVYRQCAAFGQTVHTLKKSTDAIYEIEALTDEVLSLFNSTGIN